MASHDFYSRRLDPDAVLGLHLCAAHRCSVNLDLSGTGDEHNCDSDYEGTVSVDWFKAAPIETTKSPISTHGKDEVCLFLLFFFFL